MKYILIMLIPLFWSFQSYCADAIMVEHKKAIKRLKQRKKSYVKYQQALKKREKLRVADADTHKSIRAKFERRSEKERSSFKREGVVFPMKAYKRFHKMRLLRAKKLKSAKEKYVNMKRELKKINDKSRYQVNKMEEYDL